MDSGLVERCRACEELEGVSWRCAGFISKVLKTKSCLTVDFSFAPKYEEVWLLLLRTFLVALSAHAICPQCAEEIKYDRNRERKREREKYEIDRHCLSERERESESNR